MASSLMDQIFGGPGVALPFDPDSESSQGQVAQMWGPPQSPQPNVAIPYEEQALQQSMQGAPPEAAPPGNEQSGDYETMLKQQLQDLQHPVPVPQHPRLPGPIALAVQLHPEMQNDVLGLYDRQYQDQMNQYQQDQARQGKLLDVSSRLYQAQETRNQRNYQSNWAREMAAVNAGNTNYPYTIPGNAEAAAQRNSMNQSLIGERNRSGLGGGRTPKPKFASKMDHLAWLEPQIRIRQTQLSNLYNARAMMPGGREDEYQTGVRTDIESDYQRLRNQRDAINKMSDSQWKRFQDLPENEQDIITDTILHPKPPGYQYVTGGPDPNAQAPAPDGTPPLLARPQ